ncbi:helix-turn-helix domain-containing protein [Glycocaulis alkaliphilus]|uniref:helix-turn-helix domain-containing protein n=1 Tax=Glycocaulis alkaliphilus TaxID=1434191 RepID=UPI0019AFF314|nr:helix-turn-helix transcriptional regulator [Glycocaulis alkaliphilus]GGB80569.1 transcriptional regulator [Glycocaulis alkaliphilus]
MTRVNRLHENWASDPAYTEAYDSMADEFAVAHALIEARTRAGLSQAELAERMETSQSVIARMESGRHLPSTRSLQRYAHAVGARLNIALVPAA